MRSASSPSSQPSGSSSWPASWPILVMGWSSTSVTSPVLAYFRIATVPPSSLLLSVRVGRRLAPGVAAARAAAAQVPAEGRVGRPAGPADLRVQDRPRVVGDGDGLGAALPADAGRVERGQDAHAGMLAHVDLLIRVIRFPYPIRRGGSNMLPIEVISQDADLESAIERDTAALAELRWHWTLNDSNPNRVTISEYARQVGRVKSTISTMVNGYAASLDDKTRSTRRTRPESESRGSSSSGSGSGSGLSLSDHIGKARMNQETGAAAEAVARARGLSIRGVSDPGSTPHREVRQVRYIARQLAEDHGTSIEEEVDRVAQTIVRE